MKNKLDIVKRYFSCWIKNDSSVLEEVFDKEVYYSECYGPAYKSLDQVEKWFNGVSWITFSEEDKIMELKEYQSKVPIYFPYN